MYKVIVFDLDQTLWWCVNTWIDMSAGAPFTRVETDALIDREGYRLELFTDSRRVLEALLEKGYELAVASRSGEPEWAHEAMKKLDLVSYFSEILIFPGTKLTHFELLKKRLDCEYSEMLFLDDERKNLDDIAGIGVDCIHVRNGVEFSQIKPLL